MEEICKQKHEHFEKSIQENKEDIKATDIRVDKLEIKQSVANVQITNLVEQIKKWVTVQTWLVGLLMTTLVGFFIWYIQQL